jgi:hypothetical protein
MRENPQLRQKEKQFTERMEQARRSGAASASEAPLDHNGDPELSDEIKAQIAQKAAEAPEAFMADLIAAAEVEKAQFVEHNIWKAAEAKADMATRALYRDYLRRVYFFGGGGGSVARHIAWIRQSLETPDGWGAFPTMALGLPPGTPPNVAGLWSGGHIMLRGLSMAVASHEWHHHYDGAIEAALDGQGEFPNHPEPWEGYAYAHMGEEI